ncbi:nitronate monooxygenase [Gammaproteobacteria bacterium]|nr:nitronate monooxygenase [Gammaproteobacteria bacterium]
MMIDQLLGIRRPLIGGAMYPCSNPELVAAVSRAGGIGIVQPVSLTWVHGHDFREGLRFIRELGGETIGLNLLIEASNKKYLERNRQWLDIALEEGVRFFVTALGKPDWVVERVHAAGGLVFHDVTHRHWAEKANDCGVDGFIAVNNRAGGHAGDQHPHALFDAIAPLGKPVVCAGGVGSADQINEALAIGYAGVQLGTRLIASSECSASNTYKQAIIDASADDIVLTTRLTGVPVSVINNDYVKRHGGPPGWIARKLMAHPRGKHWLRLWWSMRSAWQLKRNAGSNARDGSWLQAGKSAGTIDAIKPVADIVAELFEQSDNPADVNSDHAH